MNFFSVVRYGLFLFYFLIFLFTPIRGLAQSFCTVQLSFGTEYVSMSNDLIGIRVPAEQPILDESEVPSPINGVKYIDGNWSTPASNMINFTEGIPNFNLPNPMTVSGDCDEDGAWVTVRYEFSRPDGSPGFYQVHMELLNDQPAIMIEEHSNFGIETSFNVYNSAFRPDFVQIAQYKEDILKELDFSDEYQSPKIANWVHDPFKKAWYQLFYDADGADDSNVLGGFSGRTSKLMGVQTSGVNIGTSVIPADMYIAEACDDSGNCFYTYQIDGEINFGAIGSDNSLLNSFQAYPAINGINPQVYVNDNAGEVVVLTVDEDFSSGIVYKSTFSLAGFFSGSSVLIDLGFPITSDYPFARGAAKAGIEYLLVVGDQGSVDCGGGDIPINGVLGTAHLLSSSATADNYEINSFLRQFTTSGGYNFPPILSQLENGVIGVYGARGTPQDFGINHIEEGGDYFITGSTTNLSTCEIYPNYVGSACGINCVGMPVGSCCPDCITGDAAGNNLTSLRAAAIDEKESTIFVLGANFNIHLIKFGVDPAGDLCVTNFKGPFTGFNSNNLSISTNNSGPDQSEMAVNDNADALVFYNGQFIYYENATDTWVIKSGSHWDAYQTVGIESSGLDFIITGVFINDAQDVILNRTIFDGTNLNDNSYGTISQPAVEFQSTLDRFFYNADDSGNLIPKFEEVRFEWGIYTHKKAEAIPGDLEAYPPILQSMNYLSGLASYLQPDCTTCYEDPLLFSQEFLEGGIYLSPDEMVDLIDELLASGNEALLDQYDLMDGTQGACGNAENSVQYPLGRTFLAWENPALVQYVYDQIVNFVEVTIAEGEASNTDKLYPGLRDVLINGDGIYNERFRYWKGTNQMRSLTMQIACMFANPDTEAALAGIGLDAYVQMLRYTSLFARICWDNDFTPFQYPDGISPVMAGVNFANANERDMFESNRYFFSMLFDRDKPEAEFYDRFLATASVVEDEILTLTNQYGAAYSSTHYQQNATGVHFFTAIQLQQIANVEPGINDPFAQHTARYSRHGEFLLNLLTPPSPRFMDVSQTPALGYRKVLPVGDSPVQNVTMFATLATGLSKTAASLPMDDMPSYLQYAYLNGHYSTNSKSPVTLALNRDIEAEAPLLGHGNFPGYYSVLRNAFGSNHETASWMIVGDYYRDHFHQDQGHVTLYAHNAPIALDWAGQYNPRVSIANMHNVVVPIDNFENWNGSNQPIQNCVGGHARLLNRPWPNGNQYAFSTFANSAYSAAEFSNSNSNRNWNRSVYQLSAQEDFPIILIKDEVSDPNEEYIWTMNFLSDRIFLNQEFLIDDPELDIENEQVSCSANPDQDSPDPGHFPLLEAGSTFSYAEGINRFDFFGQYWPGHASGGVNWLMFTVDGSDRETAMTEFEIAPGTSYPNEENHQFRAAASEDPNYSPCPTPVPYGDISFTERQQMLRIKGSGDFFSLIIPYLTTDNPVDFIGEGGLEDNGNGFYGITIQGNVYHIGYNAEYYSYDDGSRYILTSFTDEEISENDVSISGGPTEVEVIGKTAYIRVHNSYEGSPANFRVVELPPGNWTSDDDLIIDQNVVTISYENTDPFYSFSSGGYEEYVLVLSLMPIDEGSNLKEKSVEYEELAERNSESVDQEGIYFVDAFPSPAKESITLLILNEMETYSPLPFEIQMVNSIAQKVNLNYVGYLDQGMNSIELDISGLTSDTYFIQIKTANAISEMRKIVVAK